MKLNPWNIYPSRTTCVFLSPTMRDKPNWRYELESNRVERGEQNLSFGNEQKEYSDPQSIRAPIVATVLGFQIAPVNN